MDESGPDSSNIRDRRPNAEIAFSFPFLASVVNSSMIPTQAGESTYVSSNPKLEGAEKIFTCGFQ